MYHENQTKMKELRNQKIMALIAVILLATAYFAFGQDVQARSFRDEGKKEYDATKYFNLALIIKSDGLLDQTDSIQVIIRERDSLTATGFMVCEKTDIYLPYDKMYLVSITRKGYSTAQLLVGTGVKVKEYGGYIPVNLDKCLCAKSIGVVTWDSRINDIHYYPEPRLFK